MLTLITYFTGEIPLYLAGTLYLHVILIHSSEAVDLLRRITATKTSPGLIFTGIFKHGQTVEYTDCNVWLFSMAQRNSSSEYCNFSHNGQPWYCDKPTNLDCEDISRYTISRTDDACKILQKSMLFEK